MGREIWPVETHRDHGEEAVEIWPVKADEIGDERLEFGVASARRVIVFALKRGSVPLTCHLALVSADATPMYHESHVVAGISQADAKYW